ncbi:MAG: glycosyltransferase, partial [Pseudomonadota bacterium]
MRVVVFSQNNPGVYSGGRYHALMLAEALAHGGHDVHYITNALPVFFKDFEAFPHHTRIRTTITENFVVDLAGEEIDAIVVTPGRSDHPVYYNAARMAALWSGAQIFLINFESGNWFNSLAPQARDLGNWDHWKRVIEYGGTVLSSAQESEDWAKRFYVEHPETTNFAVWSPPINSAAADSVGHVEKENRAVIISRLSDPHKGMDAILDILPDEMAGWALTIISGTPDVDERFLSDLRAMAQTRDISLDFSFRPNDAQKFYELKRAKLMIFPSLFEGYGYPPLEALYCNTDVVAYDLPVVRETSGAGPYYAAHGDKSALKAALREALLDPALGTRNHHQTVRDLVHMDSAAERLTALLKQETTDARRTTQVRFEAPPPPTASERLTGAMPGPLRRFVQKQGVRWTRLKTREGRRSYAKRLAQMAAPATRETKQARLDLTAATVDEMGVISIRGWRLGGQKADKIEARIGDRLVIPGQVGLARPDLAVKYPQYNDPNAGWEVTGRFMDEDVLGQPVDVLFYGGDTLLGRVGSTMAPAPSNAIHWQARREAEAGAARGRLCLILADLEDALIGAPGLHDLKNLAAALKYGGTPSILLLNGEELDAEGQIKHLKGLFDEVLLADPTKPALKPHQPPHLPNHLAALEKALHQIQNSRLLASAVAVGPQLVDALTILNPDIRRGVYLPMAMGDQLPSMNRLALISPDHSTVSAALEAGQDGLHLPLSSLAYGTPQEPIYGTSTLLVPAMGHGLSIEAARALTEDLAVGSSKQPTLIQALLQRGEPITAPFEHANARIEPLAPAEDSATYYANAALVVVPAIEALKT